MNVTFPLGRYYLRALDRNRPVPLSTVLLLRRLSAGADCLVGRNFRGPAAGALRHPELRYALRDETLGTWSLCVESLNFLEQEIQKYRPRTILEFGSGISTLCLAHFMKDLHGDDGEIHVLSVEQNHSVVGSTTDRLAQAGLLKNVRLITAPLIQKRIMDRQLSCYAISTDDLKEISAFRPEFVLVDGPAAEAGARFATLPLVREAIASHAHVYLDDAFRDGELDVAKAWLKLLGMEIDGVLPTAKGLLVGRVGHTGA
jgi:hypothetical protein